MRGLGGTPQELFDENIFTINVRETRTSDKIEAIKELFAEMKVGPGIITETNLSKVEVNRLAFGNFRVANEECRGDVPRGGVQKTSKNFQKGTIRPSLLMHVRFFRIQGR